MDSHARRLYTLIILGEGPMAHIDRCIPGTMVRIVKTGVPRVSGRTGTIVEVSRIQRLPTDPLSDRITVDVEGHGDIVVAPGDVDIVDG